MEIRNVTKTSDFEYECEINHPIYGWIPFTANANDSENSTVEILDIIGKMNASLISDTPIDIVKERRLAKQKVVSWAENFTSIFTADTPAAEVASWSYKAVAAKNHLNGNSDAMILAEAQMTGENDLELAQKILQKSAAYTTIIAMVSGIRRNALHEIDNCHTREQINSVILSALQKASSEAAKIGISV